MLTCFQGDDIIAGLSFARIGEMGGGGGYRGGGRLRLQVVSLQAECKKGERQRFCERTGCSHPPEY